MKTWNLSLGVDSVQAFFGEVTVALPDDVDPENLPQEVIDQLIAKTIRDFDCARSYFRDGGISSVEEVDAEELADLESPEVITISRNEAGGLAIT